MDIQESMSLGNFNSLPHAEVDGTGVINPVITIAFQLTTSRRGRRRCRFVCSRHRKYFNSLPHAEVDGDTHANRYHVNHFNSLPHAEVDFHLSVVSLLTVVFQLTTSRRGRLIQSSFLFVMIIISTHYLTQR